MTELARKQNFTEHPLKSLLRHNANPISDRLNVRFRPIADIQRPANLRRMVKREWQEHEEAIMALGNNELPSLLPVGGRFRC